MTDPRPTLSLAHSPDPDDAFMWWPITGKAKPGSGGGPEGRPAELVAPPAIDTGRFCFAPIPLDIDVLNRRAAAKGDLDITALSVRALADVHGRYVLTSCGASFGEGYGPKVVCHADSRLKSDGDLRTSDPLIAVPGARTTAFLTLSLLLGMPFRFIEMPFDRIIGAVARREADAGLIIHEGQLTFADAGLRQLVDVGEWWGRAAELPLPLGVNAVRRDLDTRFGAGSLTHVADTLRRSVRHALEHRAESIDYAIGFAMANEGGGSTVSRARVEAFVDMYVTRLTVDMGDRGREAIRRLLADGARAGLCPAVPSIDVI